MQKNLKTILQSFAVVPVLTASFAFGGLPGVVAGSPLAAVIYPDQNRTTSGELADNKQELALEAAKVDAYFAKYDRPLAGYGQKLVQAAVDNDLPPYAVAALAQIETSGGQHGCAVKMKNPFGYGSCKIAFKSIDEAIETVAEVISGNSSNPKLAAYYKGKSFETQLVVYNGKGVNPNYVPNVKAVMNQIDSIDVSEQMLAAASKAKA